MMNQWGYANMTGRATDFGVGSLIEIIIVVDLILLGIWLWRKISEK